MRFFTVVFLNLISLTVCALDVSSYGFHVGLDGMQRKMSMKPILGANLTRTGFTQGVLHGKLMFNDYMGLELGYQNTFNRTRALLSDDEVDFFKTAIAPGVGEQLSIKTRSTIQGPYAQLVGFLPLSDAYRLGVFGAIGFSKLKARMHSRMDIIQGGAIIEPGEYDLFFKKKAWIPKITLGIQHMMTDAWGLRTLLSWEKTSKFKNILGVQRGSAPQEDFRASFKNSSSLGVGVFYSF